MTKKPRTERHPTDWQRRVRDDLRAAAEQQPYILTHVSGMTARPDGAVDLRIQVNTTTLGVPAPNGLALHENEEFGVRVGSSDLTPPTVYVTHDRFLGYPHVLQGERLCLYLDPSREWDPAHGGAGLMDRLWRWLSDAVAGRFDANLALYHPVGGVLHESGTAPTIVIRHDLDQRRAQSARLFARTDRRLDLHPTGTADDERVPIFRLRCALPQGGGRRLGDLLAYLDPETKEATALLLSLAASAIRNSPGSPQRLLLAVPHPAGGPDHLLALQLPTETADALRTTFGSRTRPLDTITSRDVDPDVELKWMPVSDERPKVTRRRDERTPMNAYLNKSIHIWGCGGLGSWIAEFIARAGARRIVLCDPGRVTGGLLVRQNHVENDIGDTKVAALSRRLRTVSDALKIEEFDGAVPDGLTELPGAADLVIDATISHAISGVADLISRQLDGPSVAQVAADTRTGTLAIANVATAGTLDGIHAIDALAGKHVHAASALENYEVFWTEPLAGDEFVPTRGCSVPTFHGSSADMAAVAASLVTMIGRSMLASVSGTHLIALPHSGVEPAHRFIPYEVQADHG